MLTVNNPAHTWNGMTSPADATYVSTYDNKTGGGYGSLSATYLYDTRSGPACQVALTYADGYTQQVAATFNPTVHHFTALNAHTILSGGSSYHLDTTSVSQFQSHMYVQANDTDGRQVYLNDTMSGRTSVLNYGATVRQDFRLPVMNNVPTCSDGLGPEFWLNRSGTCSGEVNVTSDAMAYTTDANGNPVWSGGFEIEDLEIDGYTYSSTGAYPTPIAFSGVNFRGDSTATDASPLVSYQNSGGWGVSFAYGKVYTDSGNTVWASKNGLSLDPVAPSGTVVDVNVNHMYVNHVAIATAITYPSTPTFNLVAHYTNNYSTFNASDFLDFVGTGTVSDHVTITDNFHFLTRNGAFNHSDSFQQFPTSLGCGISAPCYIDFKRNFAVRDDGAPGSSIGDATPVGITNPGTYTSGLNTTYSPFGSIAVATRTGSGFGAALATVVLGASGVTSVTVGQDNGGYNYAVGDTVAPAQTATGQAIPGCTLQAGSGGTKTTVCTSAPGTVLTVNSITGNQDFQGGPFFNPLSSTDYFVCDFENNVYIGTLAQGMSVNRCVADPNNGNAPSVASNNTVLNDFMADGGVGSPPGVGLVSAPSIGANSVVAMDRNLVSKLSIAAGGGGVITSCYPTTSSANCGSTSADPSQLIGYAHLNQVNAGCVPIASATSTGCAIFADYVHYVPNFNTLSLGPGTRALTIYMLTPAPSTTTGVTPDGTCLGALCPADIHGVVSWNPGAVTFNPAATHTPAQ